MIRIPCFRFGEGVPAALLLLGAFTACASHDNHLVYLDVPSGRVVGVATEAGILALRKPEINRGDVYPMVQPFRDGVVTDEARVEKTDEFLALLKPLSSKLSAARLLLYPIEAHDDLYVGVLDEAGQPHYLDAALFREGRKGDFLVCHELADYPPPSKDGYGGLGLFDYREGALWLVGILTPLQARFEGAGGAVYAYIGMERIQRLLPQLKDRFKQERRPFRPDFEHGVKRDGSGE